MTVKGLADANAPRNLAAGSYSPVQPALQGPCTWSGAKSVLIYLVSFLIRRADAKCRVECYRATEQAPPECQLLIINKNIDLLP